LSQLGDGNAHILRDVGEATPSLEEVDGGEAAGVDGMLYPLILGVPGRNENLLGSVGELMPVDIAAVAGEAIQ